MMYAFTKEDAARSFREAQQRDPTCAICYWGEAWAWGSYLNGAMREREAPHAYAAIQKALALADDHASANEKAFIEAMGRAPMVKTSRRIPPTPVAAPWYGSTAEGWLCDSILKARA